MESNSGRPTKIHPCICGFVCDKHTQMKHHRKACEQWQSRPNPMGIMSARRRDTRMELAAKSLRFVPCPICKHRPDHHDNACPNSQGEKVRRDLIAKHGINPYEFEVLLRLLAKRYEPSR